jgi:hypothetical protein
VKVPDQLLHATQGCVAGGREYAKYPRPILSFV